MGQEALATEAQQKQRNSQDNDGRCHAHDDAGNYRRRAEKRDPQAKIEAVDIATDPNQADSGGQRAEGIDQAEIAVGAREGAADFGAENADEIGLPETGEQCDKQAEGEKPPVLVDKAKVIHVGLYLVRRPTEVQIMCGSIKFARRNF